MRNFILFFSFSTKLKIRCILPTYSTPKFALDAPVFTLFPEPQATFLLQIRETWQADSTPPHPAGPERASTTSTSLGPTTLGKPTQGIKKFRPCQPESLSTLLRERQKTRGMFSFIIVMGLEAACLLQAPEVIIKRDKIK